MDFGGLPTGELPYMVGTNDLAMELQAKASSVTNMLLKLAERGHVAYVPYQGALLTPSGVYLAYQVVRRHRLWEYFLAKRLGFSSHEIHELAEEMEHVRSLPLTERLAKYLEEPQWDPHGDPIPSEDGTMPAMRRETLWDAQRRIHPRPTGQEFKFSFCGFANRSSDLNKVIQSLGIRIGNSFQIHASPQDHEGLCTVQLPDLKEVIFTEAMAKEIMVVRKYPFGTFVLEEDRSKP